MSEPIHDERYEIIFVDRCNLCGVRQAPGIEVLNKEVQICWDCLRKTRREVWKMVLEATAKRREELIREGSWYA